MHLPSHADIRSRDRRSEALFSLIDDQLGEVRALIDKQLVSPAFGSCSVGCLGGKPNGSEPIMPYLRDRICRGKMLRPGMVLLAGGACGKITDEHIHIAAIIEMIHNATLLHDDVIDEGQQRRGLRTVNRMWGNEFAVLVGDFLLSRVFHMCADLESRITDIVAETAVRICEGELRQVIQRRNWQLSESEYIDIITEKSAALFSSACLLGGLLSQGADAQLQSLSCFGRNVGIAFQITDDLLDITGDESQTGKTLGSDVDKSKLTLAVIHLLSILGGKEKREVIKYLERDAGCDETEPRYNQEDLLEKLRSSGSLEYAHKRAKEFVGRAVEAIALLDESGAKNALMETAEFAANRAF